MKFRRIVTTAAALALGVSLGAPALAASESADARLTRVTQAVKAALDIGDTYTGFYGEPQEGPLGTSWELSWSTEDTGISVTATDGGKVLSYTTWEGSSNWDNRYGPSFPDMTKAQAKEAARAFLGRVLADGESASFDEEEDSTEDLSAESCGFRGTILLNGISSPLRFYVRVRLSDGAVRTFWRDDVSEYVGSLPGARSSITADSAADKLRTTLSLELRYVQDQPGEQAVLRYVPRETDDFYVDAATGELVNLTELRRQLVQNNSGGGDKAEYEMSSDAAAPEEAGGLTDAELSGISKLEGVLDRDALAAEVGRWSQLGLTGYELVSVSYWVDRDTGEVTAQLSYAKKTADGIARRYVTADARTGALREVSGYRPCDAKAQPRLTAQAAQSGAEAFLKALWPELFGRTALYDSREARQGEAAHSFTFAQKVNGYFFPDNAITVRVDAADGSILGVSRNFDDAVTFDSAGGLITEEQALDAWLASYDVSLSYIAVPAALDLMGEEARPLLDAGYSYYNTLRPGYALEEQSGWYTGVDAKTGALAEMERSQSAGMVYDDISGHWAQAALTELARYDVGWRGGKARPDQALTQLDYIALLASADGYGFDPAEDDADSLYQYACQRGLITREERDEDRTLTRMEMVEMLLNSLGYGPVAGLQGIFRCDFTDAADIPAERMGYAALAQGLGIIRGDGGRFYPSRTATRGEAAVMLWQYMKR